ncbi:MAG TPA: hypothetical protein PLK75_00500 [Bacteroidales bacterium]|nr:hypothetical protein [Bacteroidales bacterium]
MNPNEIKIIDDSGVEQLIDFELRQCSQIVPFREVKAQIKKMFLDCYNHVETLFGDHAPRLITVRLEQEKTNLQSVIMASFRPTISTVMELKFSFHYHTVQLVCADLNDKTDENTGKIKRIILHELIHAADLKNLNQFHLSHTAKSAQPGNIPSQMIFGETFGSGQYNYTSHYLMLHFIQKFRAEGVAILGERLLNQHKYSQEIGEFIKYFASDFHYVIGKSRDIQFFEKNIDKVTVENLNIICERAYMYGDAVMFSLIAQKHGKDFKFLDLSRGFDNFIIPVFTYSDAIEFMKLCINFDMSDYINGMLRLTDNNGNTLIDHNKFYNYCGFIQNETTGSINEFCLNISKTALHYNKEAFISTLKDVLGSKMQKEEIIELIAEFENTTPADNISKDIKVLASQLVEKINTEDSEIVIWALTYLLDDEDMIHDELDFVGLQDDWFVLKAAAYIISGNEKSNQL